MLIYYLEVLGLNLKELKFLKDYQGFVLAHQDLNQEPRCDQEVQEILFVAKAVHMIYHTCFNNTYMLKEMLV